MKRYTKSIFYMVLACSIVSTVCNAEEIKSEPSAGLVDLDQLKAAEDKIPFDDKDIFEDDFVTKEIEGVVDAVGEDFIVIRDAEENQVKLTVDAETVIYVEDEKDELKDVSVGDNVFAFYIDEGGNLKCDLLDVVVE